MLKKLTLICALLGLVAFLAAPAYAEVQNIKVSGDITASAVYREAYDLQHKLGDVADPDTSEEDTDTFLMSVVRLRVDADLTDNVAACIRLANLREWDAVSNTAASEDQEHIILDLANVTLKEMLYSPLTLIIGRQELMYGNGLIVGPGLYHDSSGGLEYRDLSPLHGFDAVRAILDYDPWTLDLVFAKMKETDDDTTYSSDDSVKQTNDHDIDLYGANLGYKFDNYDAEMEAYLFYERDPEFDLDILDVAGSATEDVTYDKSETYVIGLRGSVVPMENLSLAGELATQLGTIYTSEDPDAITLGINERDREAFAANVAGKYDFADVRFAPVVGVEYLYTSGHAGTSNAEGDFEAWDPMYRGKVMGTIRDCLENLYETDDQADTSGWTNQHTLKATGSLELDELVDGLSLDLAYLRYWFDEDPITDADDDIGQEINLKVVYDYTEDVQFAVDGAWFIPGEYYDTLNGSGRTFGGGMTVDSSEQSGEDNASNDTAISVVGSCTVAF